MPVHRGHDKQGPFYQWGHQKKYYYVVGTKSRLIARKKAMRQGAAILRDTGSP